MTVPWRLCPFYRKENRVQEPASALPGAPTRSSVAEVSTRTLTPGAAHGCGSRHAGSPVKRGSSPRPRRGDRGPTLPGNFICKAGKIPLGSPALVSLPREQPSEGTVVVSDPFLTWSQEFNLRAQTSILCDSEQDVGEVECWEVGLCPESEALPTHMTAASIPRA